MFEIPRAREGVSKALSYQPREGVWVELISATGPRVEYDPTGFDDFSLGSMLQGAMPCGIEPDLAGTPQPVRGRPRLRLPLKVPPGWAPTHRVNVRGKPPIFLQYIPTGGNTGKNPELRNGKCYDALSWLDFPQGGTPWEIVDGVLKHHEYSVSNPEFSVLELPVYADFAEDRLSVDALGGVLTDPEEIGALIAFWESRGDLFRVAWARFAFEGEASQEVVFSEFWTKLGKSCPPDLKLPEKITPTWAREQCALWSLGVREYRELP